MSHRISVRALRTTSDEELIVKHGCSINLLRRLRIQHHVPPPYRAPYSPIWRMYGVRRQFDIQEQRDYWEAFPNPERFFGQVPDTIIAEVLNVSAASVNRIRLWLGISSSKEVRWQCPCGKPVPTSKTQFCSRKCGRTVQSVRKAMGAHGSRNRELDKIYYALHVLENNIRNRERKR